MRRGRGAEMPEACIFLVEDEALIRMMLAEMVAGQALAETAIFDLAILDINIAGDIITPVAEIIDRRGLPFIFVSGYGPRGRPEAFRGRPALPKPLQISKLGETIDAILATAG